MCSLSLSFEVGVFFFLPATSSNLFLSDPEALLWFWEEAMIEGVLVLIPMVFQLGGVIVPTGLNYRNKNMNAQCILLHGGCCCLGIL